MVGGDERIMEHIIKPMILGEDPLELAPRGGERHASSFRGLIERSTPDEELYQLCFRWRQRVEGAHRLSGEGIDLSQIRDEYRDDRVARRAAGRAGEERLHEEVQLGLFAFSREVEVLVELEAPEDMIHVVQRAGQAARTAIRTAVNRATHVIEALFAD